MKPNSKTSTIFGLTIWILSSFTLTRTAYAQTNPIEIIDNGITISWIQNGKIAQDTPRYVSIDRWRADLAAHDILRKRVQDSLISDQCKQIDDLTDRVEKQQLIINDYHEISKERLNIINTKESEVYSYQKEVAELKQENRKIRRHRNVMTIAAFVLAALFVSK